MRHSANVQLPASVGRDWTALSDRAFRLNVAAWGESAEDLTDGRLTKHAVRAVRARVRATTRHIVELVDAGLWERTCDGYRLVSFLDHNPDRAYWERRRERWRVEQRRRRERAKSRSVVAPDSAPDIQPSVVADSPPRTFAQDTDADESQSPLDLQPMLERLRATT